MVQVRGCVGGPPPRRRDLWPSCPLTRRISLDAIASTPIRHGAHGANAPYLERAFGNPSRLHGAGQPARTATEEAREAAAAVLGASTGYVIPKSAGSAPNNQDIKVKTPSSARQVGISCGI